MSSSTYGVANSQLTASVLPVFDLAATKDFRAVMAPYTAMNLKARKKNVLKDFVHMAGE